MLQSKGGYFYYVEEKRDHVTSSSVSFFLDSLSGDRKQLPVRAPASPRIRRTQQEPKSNVLVSVRSQRIHNGALLRFPL